MVKKKRVNSSESVPDLAKLWKNTVIERFRAKDSELKTSSPDALEKILVQRQTQREVIFKFALFWTKMLLILLIAIIILQSVLSMYSNGKIILIEKTSLSILSVSILGQFIGVIIVIAKALWDDEPYKEFFKDKKS